MNDEANCIKPLVTEDDWDTAAPGDPQPVAARPIARIISIVDEVPSVATDAIGWSDLGTIPEAPSVAPKRETPRERREPRAPNPLPAAVALGRTLPHSIEAEENLLSCCLIDGADDASVVRRCVEAGIRKDFFYEPKHGIIYARILDLYRREQPVDIALLAEDLKASGQLEQIGGSAFLAQATDRQPTTAQASFYIDKVLGLHRLRRLETHSMRVLERVAAPGADAVEIIADLRAEIERVTDNSPGIGAGITAAALCATPPTVPPEVIAGVLYLGGTMMISGPSKSRKTYTFLDLGVSVATGTEWLGFSTTKTAVLYLNFELSEHSFQRRLAAICQAKCQAPPAGFRSFNLRGKTATMGMLAVELPRLIKSHAAGLVILDPWYKISAQSGVEENSNDGQARILAEAERIVTANGATLAVGHHCAKGDSAAKNSIDRAAGAGAMARWGDVIATLSEHEEADAMILELHLRDFAPVAPIALRWDQPLWRRDASLDPAKLRKPGPKNDHPSAVLLEKLTDGMTSREWRTAPGFAISGIEATARQINQLFADNPDYFSLLGSRVRKATGLDEKSRVFPVVAGIDVGGAEKGYHLVAIQGAAILGTKTTQDPIEAARWCRKNGARLVAVDAPSGWSNGEERRCREAEEMLSRQGYAEEGFIVSPPLY